jgi:hypothetical protein
MTESREVVAVRGPSTQSRRGLDNMVRGQHGHAGSMRGKLALTCAGAHGSQSRGARLLA